VSLFANLACPHLPTPIDTLAAVQFPGHGWFNVAIGDRYGQERDAIGLPTPLPIARAIASNGVLQALTAVAVVKPLVDPHNATSAAMVLHGLEANQPTRTVRSATTTRGSPAAGLGSEGWDTPVGYL
jgi:hypothetical protein